MVKHSAQRALYVGVVIDPSMLEGQSIIAFEWLTPIGTLRQFLGLVLGSFKLIRGI